MRALVLLALLAGCATAPKPPQFPECPDPVAVPAALGKHETVGVLEIRVELAREAERARADACAGAVDAMRAWIGGRP